MADDRETTQVAAPTVGDEVATTSKQWRRRVLAVIAVALVARVVCVLGQPLIGADSARFLAATEMVEKGQYNGTLREDYHPLPAFVFATANRAIGAVVGESEDARAARQRREFAAYLAGVIAGVIAVWAMMDLTRRLFPAVSPVMVGLLAALHPYLVRTSADIMSDGIFIAMFLIALRQAHDTLQRRSLLAAAVTGGAIGLAYLSRPEALVLVPTIGLYWISAQRREPGRWVANSGLLALGVVALVFPYVLALFYDSGEWMLTRKKSLSALLGLVDTAPVQAEILRAGVVDALFDPRAAWRVLTRWFFASPEVLAVATVVGVAGTVRKHEWCRGHTLFAMAMGFLMVIFLLLLHSSEDYGYVTKRHVIAIATLCLPFSARGIVTMGRSVGSWVPKAIAHRGPQVVLAAVLLATGVKALAPQRYDQLAQRDAAEYIHEHGGDGQLLFTPREKIAYYSGGERASWSGDYATLLEHLREHDRAWIVFYREKWPDLHERLSGEIAAGRANGLVLETTFAEDRRPRHIDLFRWTRP